MSERHAAVMLVQSVSLRNQRATLPAFTRQTGDEVVVVDATPLLHDGHPPAAAGERPSTVARDAHRGGRGARAQRGQRLPPHDPLGRPQEEARQENFL